MLLNTAFGWVVTDKLLTFEKKDDDVVDDDVVDDDKDEDDKFSFFWRFDDLMGRILWVSRGFLTACPCKGCNDCCGAE